MPILNRLNFFTFPYKSRTVSRVYAVDVLLALPDGGGEKDVLNHNNRVIKNELDRESIRRQQSESSLYSLQLQLEEYQEFIDSIPEGLKKQLLERYEQNQEQEQEMNL